ncbi:hypothetical protein BDY24DRAFT_416355 [Mrakia frigida]|uniref:uncharacterized protein n=1 Tax=Mrakia frigida TaxID=29902 RepID=UPI003FCC1BA9
MTDIEKFRVPGHSDLAYIPDFVSEAESDYIVKKIAESPLPKWKNVPTGRRLQYWGGTLTKTNTLIPEALPAWVTQFPDLIDRIKDLGVYSDSKIGQPNQVLINEYRPGEGIDPHSDGPAYYPTTCSLSLLWPTLLFLHPPPPPTVALNSIMDLTPPDLPPIVLLLEPRSLLVLQGEKYTDWKHEIKHVFEDDFGAVEVVNREGLKGKKVQELVGEKGVGRKVKRERRVSLTFRTVEKVGKGLVFGR